MKALRILVVEDDSVIAALLAEVLADLGHDVCALAGTMAEAVAAARRCLPDLLIVDATLGNDSGIAAVAEITRLRPVPHVFVSGDLAIVRALRPGAVVIQKPYRQVDLARAIGQALSAVAA